MLADDAGAAASDSTLHGVYIAEVTGSGRHYLLAVMTDGDPTEDYGIATIERIAAVT